MKRPSEHTPEPWKISSRDCGAHGREYRILNNTETVIAEIKTGLLGDAVLVAAAPKLLEALEAMKVIAGRGPRPRKLDDAMIWKENDELAWSLARAAIAKAKGWENKL